MLERRFTDGRVPDANIVSLFNLEHRLQRWLEVEAALAQAEATLGIIPKPAAAAIKRAADISLYDIDRIQAAIEATSHPLMALVVELSTKVGEPYGGWVHWGATTQNIMQTGDILILREAHETILHLLGKIFAALDILAERGADVVCAGRTHGQQAVPITFGLKVAAWVDELARHVERLHESEKRVFTAMTGGAVGSFGSFGKDGPAIQESVARILKLQPMCVPSRAVSDSFAEYVSILAMLAATGGKIAREVYMLMKTEFGEVKEPAPDNTIGSSTMPHKRNPQLADDCIFISAQIRSLVPLALEGMLHDHEGRDANFLMTNNALRQSCILSGDLLSRLIVILSGLEIDEKRMGENLALTGGLINSEAVMLTLGEFIGRQHAHEIVYKAAQVVTRDHVSFAKALYANPEIAKHMNMQTLTRLLDPKTKTGLSTDMSHDAAKRAHSLAMALTRK